MIFEVAECVVDYLIPGRSELCELSRWVSKRSDSIDNEKLSHLPGVRCQTMTQLSSNLPDFGKSLRREGCQLVSILLMACKRKHLGAQPHELDAILVVPSKHFDGIPRVGQPQALHPSLTSRNIRLLILVRPILGRMLRQGRVCEWVPVLQDGSYATGTGAEYRRLGCSQVRVQTSLLTIS